MMKELVSAIITTHNRLEYLKAAIQSVKNQTYDNIEIIVVDDCSDDGTREYCLQDSELNYIRLDNRSGANHARNIGIQASVGKYVAFLDDDDEWLPAKIEKQIDLIDEENNIYCVGCAISRVGKSIKVRENTEKLYEGDLSKTVFYTIPYRTSTLFINKELVDKIEGFDEELSSWQEYELEIRLFQRTNVATVRQNLVEYRVGNKKHKNISNRIEGWEKDVLYIDTKHKELIEKLDEEFLLKRRVLIASEGARKAEASNLSDKKKEYLKELFLLQPTVKNFIRRVFGFYSYKRLIGIF